MMLSDRLRMTAGFVALAVLAPFALAAHPQGKGAESLGGRTVPRPETWTLLEAESFADLSAGELLSDPTASGGKAWRFPTYGTIHATIEVAEAGVLWVETRARGSHPPDLMNPHLHVMIDGIQRGEWDVNGSWLAYPQSIPITAGRHTLSVDNFDNYRGAPAPREMIVDWVRIGGPTLVGAPRVSATASATVDARDIHNSVTGMLQTDETARQKTAWLQWGVGCFGEVVVFEDAGKYTFTPRVRGNEPNGEGTHAIVFLDGTEVENYSVGEAWMEHTTTFTVEKGAHVIDLCYDNDEGAKGKRNLWLDEFTIRWAGEARSEPKAEPWALPHGNAANTRNLPSRVAAANVAEADEVWRYDGGGAVTGTPAIVDGVVYYGDWNGGVHAVKLADGSRVWREIRPGGIDSSVAIERGSDGARSVVYGDMKGFLNKLDAATGKEIWRVAADPVEGAHLYGSPVVLSDRVCTGVASEQTLIEYTGEQTFRGSVACFALADGRLLWRTHTQPEGGRGVSVWSTPAVDEKLGLLFVGTGNSYGSPVSELSDAIVALRLRDGSIAWSFQATANDAFNARGAPGPDRDFGASPMLFEVGGRALVGDGDKGGTFYALDRATGELVWKTRVDFKKEGYAASQVEGFLGSAAYANGTIFAPTTARSMVHALDAATGEIRWATELAPMPETYGMRMFGAATAVVGGALQGSPAGRVFALDGTTGKILANLSVKGGVQGGVSVSGNRFVVPDVGANLWSGRGGLTAFEVPALPDDISFSPPDDPPRGNPTPGTKPGDANPTAEAPGVGVLVTLACVALAGRALQRGPQRRG